MLVWHLHLINKDTGEYDVNGPRWIAITFGGTSESEIQRQIEEAKESVMVSNNGPPKIHLEEENEELTVDIVEFNAMGVARL